MSKLKDFLAEKQIDPRRVVAVSRRIERLRDEDRAVRLAKAQVRAGKGDDATKERAATKPRSGRPVTGATLDAALEGRPVSGPAKTRITRAVNYVLAQKKQPEAALKELFA